MAIFILAVVAETQLQEMRKNGDRMKQELYRSCRENGPGSHPLRTTLPEIASPSLLDRVQERLDVEGTLRQLRRQRLKERGDVVYIYPQQPKQPYNLMTNPDSHRWRKWTSS